MKPLNSILAAATTAVAMSAPNVLAQETKDTTMGIHTAVAQIGNNAPIEIAVQGIEECPGVPSVNAVHFNKTVTTVCYDSEDTVVYSGICVPNGTSVPDCDNNFPARKEQVSTLTLQP